MDEEPVKAAADKGEGLVKEGVGHVSGDKKLENEGKSDWAKDAMHNALGAAKGAGEEAIASVKNAPSRRYPSQII